jgi:nucleotide-binding universal stress UspA family protein
MKILLATDGSDDALRACEVVAGLPPEAAAEVVLVHVTTPLPEPEVPFPTVFSEEDLRLTERIEQTHEERAAQRLEAARRALPAAMAVTTDPRVGSPEREILAAATAHRPDLVVLGARGIDGAPAGEAGKVGGVAQQVARDAPCPVLLVRPGPVRFRRALVALDRSPGGGHTVAWLKGAGWLKGCALTLAHVVEDRFLRETRVAAVQLAGGEGYLERLRTHLLEDAQGLLDGHAEALAAAGWEVDTQVLEGDPAEALAARSEAGSCDLVVVGARGRHGLGRYLLGGTAQKVIRRAAASVLVVHTGDAA